MTARLGTIRPELSVAPESTKSGATARMRVPRLVLLCAQIVTPLILVVLLLNWMSNALRDPELAVVKANADEVVFHGGALNVSLRQDALEVRAADGTTTRVTFDAGEIPSSIFATSQPYAVLRCVDGIPNVTRNPQLTPLRTAGGRLAQFAKSPFPLFSFFGEHPTTFGLLLVQSDGVGGSNDRMVLFDTESGYGVAMPFQNCNTRDLWIFDGAPPSFAITRAVSLGLPGITRGKARPDRVFSFGPKGYVLNADLEAKVFVQRFGATEFNRADLELFKQTSIADFPVDDEFELAKAERLVDFLYYGKKVGREKEVAEFAKALHPSYRGFLDSLGIVVD